ncbi:MAG TPA: hypothetical protein VMM55_12560 [Thermohalobaculum sp.]|nr:hypothetical protein [Thermohalobaculum sp.]
MIRSTMLAGAALLLAVAPAYASHCPADAEAIDAGLAAIEVSDEVRAEVESLRDEGMEQHEAGDHAAAEAALAEAMRLLLNNVGAE